MIPSIGTLAMFAVQQVLAVLNPLIGVGVVARLRSGLLHHRRGQITPKSPYLLMLASHGYYRQQKQGNQ